ncbi:MAG: 50S ribosomal protein L24 [Myxococcales bacterium]|nr:50S ribosomal protein L24 [Myxococcales bacterium]
MRIRKNDTVVVLSGKDRGRRGRVLEFLDGRQRMRVEGVNQVKRHVKAGRDPKAPRGGIIDVSAPIHVSNVRVVCSKCSQPTDLGMKTLEDGKRVRFCRKCNEVVDK